MNDLTEKTATQLIEEIESLQSSIGEIDSELTKTRDLLRETISNSDSKYESLMEKMDVIIRSLEDIESQLP